MTAFWHLLKREYWENRIAFLFTPIGVLVLVLGLMLMSLITAGRVEGVLSSSIRIEGKTISLLEGVRQFALQEPGFKADALGAALFGLATPFMFALMFAVLFYLLGALYDDRKDRSILFWKSLPVSDTSMVLSKLASAALIAPAIALAFVAVAHVLLLCLASLAAWQAGVGVWANVWGPAPLLWTWVSLALGILVHALWYAPVYGWLLLTSSYAPRIPLLFAVVPPVIIATLDSWLRFTRTFNFRDNVVWEWLGERLTPVVPLFGVRIEDDELGDGDTTRQVLERIAADLGRMLEPLGDADMWWGVLLGAVLLSAAIWVRRYRVQI